MKGKMGLVIRDRGKESIMVFGPNQALLMTGHHIGFTIDPEGFSP